MSVSKAEFFNGLLWYLEARNWACEKIKASPRGSHPFDVRMHHALYFAKFFSAVDHVRDHLQGDEQAQCAFVAKIKGGFADDQDYDYARELRNAIVHRGLDTTAAGHADDTTVYVLCPTAVWDRRRKSHTCTFKYVVELAACCNAAADAAIADELECLGLFDPARHTVGEEELRAALDASAAVPDWAKAMARKAFGDLNYAALAADLAAMRIRRMRSLLGQSELAG